MPKNNKHTETQADSFFFSCPCGTEKWFSRKCDQMTALKRHTRFCEIGRKAIEAKGGLTHIARSKTDDWETGTRTLEINNLFAPNPTMVAQYSIVGNGGCEKIGKMLRNP